MKLKEYKTPIEIILRIKIGRKNYIRRYDISLGQLCAIDSQGVWSEIVNGTRRLLNYIKQDLVKDGKL